MAARLLQQATASSASRPWQTRPRAVGSCSGEATRQWRCTATNAYLGIERPRGSSSAGSSELGGGIHGGRAPACARAEEMRQGGRERGREAWRHPGARFEAAGHEAVRGTEVGRASAMVVRALVHGRHEVILTNTRRATVKVMWGAGLGHFQAESDIGPKMKFEARVLLFIFHLETKVIRALQQRVIKPQTASVSVLTATSKRSN